MRTRPLPDRPQRNGALEPGDFWEIPLSDGRLTCGVVLGFPPPTYPGASCDVVVGLLDWVGERSPTPDVVAAAQVLETGALDVRALWQDGCRLAGHTTPSWAIDPAAVNRAFGQRYPAARSEWRFVRGEPPPPVERREIGSPVTSEMLAPFASPRAIVQFCEPLSDDDLAALGDFLIDQPDVELRIYGQFGGTITDLELLRYFPNVRHVQIVYLEQSLESFDGLRHLRTDLESLTIARTRARLDVRQLQRFPQLRSLIVDGRARRFDHLAALSLLEHLTLASVTLPDLSALVPLGNLRSLEIHAGGTRDIGLLPSVGTLASVRLSGINGLEDVDALADVSTLRSLRLEASPKVHALPSFGRSTELRRVWLESLRGVRDLAPVADAPALELLTVVGGQRFGPADFAAFRGHLTLRSAYIGTGSSRRDDEIASFLGLPRNEAVDSWDS